jgi:hypothetical protein
METLPKDLVNKLTEELSPQDLISFCKSQLHPNVKRVCNSNDFWKQRFFKDFSFLIRYFPNLEINAKQIYIQLFSKISKKAEEIVEIVLDAFEDFKRFLTKEYKDILYNHFYNSILNSIKELIDRSEDNKVDEFEIVDVAENIGHSFGALSPPYFSDSTRVENELNDFWRYLIGDAKIERFLGSMMEYLNIEIDNSSVF